MPKVARVPEWDRVGNDGAGPRTANSQALRYYAFLSYSHADKTVADWLHSSLERFRTPSTLAGRLTSNGVIPRRLTPIFRDRHELPASDNLATGIQEALDSSRFLIVLCSPAAAASRWVNAEIDMFKRRRPEGCVLAAIVAGEPFASDIPGREGEECLPPALRSKYDRRGRPTTRRAEPLATDFRDGGDGKRVGLLKLVAGMLGVGLDELVQRETLRRQRRLAIVAAASLAGMAVTSTLAVVALDARDSARDQRREAEGLVGFMLGDLRAKLEPLGRLDVLDSVGARALAYYQKQDKANLSDDSLAQRSKALTLMGEIANTRGNLDTALRLYREALAGTAEALRRAPDNPQRIFDHAQNIFWVGYIAWQRGNSAEALASFHEYKRLAQRLVSINPDKPEWRLESLYADTNLGVLLQDERQFAEATRTFRNGVRASEELLAANPGDRALQDHVIEKLGWLSESLEKSGKTDEALAQRERQLALLKQFALARRGDSSLVRSSAVAELAAGRLFAARGETEKALARLQAASAIASDLTQTDPTNTDWAHIAAGSHLELGELRLASGDVDAAGVSARAGCEIAERLIARDKSVVAWRTTLRGRCLSLRANIALETGAASEADRLSKQVASLARTELANRPGLPSTEALVNALTLRGNVAAAMGRHDQAAASWGAAVAAWPEKFALAPWQLAQRAFLLRQLGRQSESEAAVAQLATIGYRHPDYVRSVKRTDKS